MASIFLDTNLFIDTLIRRPENQILDSLKGNILYVSVLSLHIYCYIYKIKIPNTVLLAQIENFQLVDITSEIASKALSGPTDDFEDNIQLHCAAMAECDTLLTRDKKLLAMKFFGKVKID